MSARNRLELAIMKTGIRLEKSPKIMLCQLYWRLVFKKLASHSPHSKDGHLEEIGSQETCYLHL